MRTSFILDSDWIGRERNYFPKQNMSRHFFDEMIFSDVLFVTKLATDELDELEKY